MQLLFVLSVLFFFPLIRASKLESDVLSSVDIIAFGYSQQVSQHWDCPQISDRAEKAEEIRIWRVVIPDARIEEAAAASASRTLRTAKKYKWIKEGMLSSDSTTAKSNLFMQNTVLLGMRKPNVDGGAAPGKMLYSKSKHIDHDALSVVLLQLEQSKGMIMNWMARSQASLPIPSTTLKVTDSLINHRLQVPQAANYHPRAFKDAYFTTGDLVAWMAVASESRRKSHADAFKLFKVMLQSFLPGFDINLEAVPKKYAEKPTKTIYLHRSFQYVPAGADLAFYFDGNRGKFLSLQKDSIVLNRPEGIVDGKQQAALVLFLNANPDASNLEAHQTKGNITMRKAFCGELEKTVALRTSPSATDAEVQAIGVSTIHNLGAQLERDSFLEAQRNLLESRPKLLSELLPKRLVKLVIGYFDDGTYPFAVSTHRWALKDVRGIAVDSARMYVMTKSEGIKGLSHSLANINEDKRRLVGFGDPKWFYYSRFHSSHDGRYVAFSHAYEALLDQGKQIEEGAKWLTQNNEPENEKPKRVKFDGENSTGGILSRDGQTLFSCDRELDGDVTCVYRILEEPGRDPIGLMKFELSGEVLAVSGKGNRVILEDMGQLEIHEVGKDASKLVCQIDGTNFGCICALNEDGSEAAFVTHTGKLQIVKVDEVFGVKAGQPAITTVNAPDSVGWINQLIYDDGNKLHVLHDKNKISLFNSSTKKFILLKIPQEGQKVIILTISPDANYIAILQEDDKGKCGVSYKTTVERKFGKADWRDLFGCEADKNKQATKP